jgi:hypothetical protein
MTAIIVNVMITKAARMPINVIFASLLVPDFLFVDITDTEVFVSSKNIRKNISVHIQHAFYFLFLPHAELKYCWATCYD